MGRDKAKGSSENTSCKDSVEECGECGKEVVKEGVECEVCERWFHIKCVGVAVSTYKALEWIKHYIGTARGAVEG